MSYTGSARILEKPATPELLKRIPPKVVRTMQVAHSIWRTKQSTSYQTAPVHGNVENKHRKGRKRKSEETVSIKSHQYKRKAESSMILSSSVSHIAVVKDKINFPCCNKKFEKPEQPFVQIAKPKIWQPQLQENLNQELDTTLHNSVNLNPNIPKNHGFKQNNRVKMNLNDAFSVRQPLTRVGLPNDLTHQMTKSTISASRGNIKPKQGASHNCRTGEINKSQNQRTNVIVRNNFVQRPVRPPTVDLTKEEKEDEDLEILNHIQPLCSKSGFETHQIIPTTVLHATATQPSLHSLCTRHVPVEQGFSAISVLNSSTIHQQQFRKEDTSMGVPLIDLRELNPRTSTLLEEMGFYNFLPAFYAALGNKIIPIEAFVKNSGSIRNEHAVRR